MTLDLLFPHFDDLIRTPEDVERLNQTILQLAVQGRLVPQDPNDEPAGELLTKIRMKRLDSEAKNKTKSPASVADSNESPFELPDTWEWVRLDSLGNTQTGSTPPTNESEFYGHDYPFIKPADISNAGVNYRYEGLSELGAKKGCLILANSVLMVCIGGSIGKVNYVDRDCSCNQQINVLTPYMNMSAKFFSYFMRSPYFQEQVLSRAPQTTLPILSKGKWESIPLPLPPLAEQRRIVAKVDELFAQTRTLATHLRHAREEIVVINRATLHPLTTASNAPAFQAARHTLATHFDQLYADPRTVADLRQTILDLAVRGKLVAQDPHDEPASELVRKVEVEKQRLLQESIIEAAEVVPTEIDRVPLVPIGVLGDVRGGIQKSSQRRPDQNPRRYLTVAHVQRNWIDISDARYFEVSDEELIRWRLIKGDILVVEGNGSAEHIGRAAMFKGEIEDCVHQNHVIRVRPNQSFILPHFLNLYLNSPSGREQILERSRTTSGLYNLSVGRIKTMVVPLPSINEQRRIVAKVDQLLRLCDELEAKLQAGEAHGQRLTAAVLAHIKPHE